MKKRWIPILCALLLLPGCAAPMGVDEGEYTIYCLADLTSGAAGGEDAICPLSVSAEGETDTRIASALLSKLLEAEGETYSSPLPKGTEVLHLTIENGLAVVDLSDTYASLSGMDLTLADACITLTLCQMPSVERVSVLAEGKTLPYRQRQVMAAGDVLLSRMDDEMRTLRVRLFFPETETGSLLYESRTLQLYEGQTKAAAVLEALLHGPEDDALTAVLPEGTGVVSIRVDEGICYVNLTKEFVENMPESMQAQENVVYSLVKSLCSLSDIQAVQIAVEGETLEYYGGIDVSVLLS